MSKDSPVIWSIEAPKGLENKLTKPILMKYRDQINNMIRSENPRKYGIFKRTKYGPAFVTELNKSYRIAYTIDYTGKTITILRVGDHKEVYGRD